MSSDFSGIMSENYRIIYDTHPHLLDLQKNLAELINKHKSEEGVSIIELGCGDGYTTNLILDARDNLNLVALDPEIKMLSNAKLNLAKHNKIHSCKLIQSDALNYLQSVQSSSIDIIASAMTLHNINCNERNLIHKEIYRVLKPSGLFINLDKFADNLINHQNKLQKRLNDYFDYFFAKNDLDHLRDWVLHEVEDANSDRIMLKSNTNVELNNLGFKNISFTEIVAMESILTAYK